MSRPNHASAFGGTRASLRTAALGSTLVNNDGHAAISTKRAIRPTEIQKIGLLFRERQASDASERGASPASVPAAPASTEMAMVEASVMADPRVEHAVEQVHDEVGKQEHEHQDGHRADDDDAVTVVDAGEEVAADALDVEDALGDD